MFCPFCGTNNPDGIKFCGNCGGNLQPYSKTTPAAPQPSVAPPPVQKNAPVSPPKPAAVPKPATPAPAPKAVSVSTPRPIGVPMPPPKPAVAKPAVAKPAPKPRKPINKAAILSGCLKALAALLYAGVALMMLLFLYSDTGIYILGENETILTMPSFLQLLMNGSEWFHPTILSITLSISVWALTFAVPLLATTAAAAVFSKKRNAAFHTACAIGACASTAALLLTPIAALRFVPELKRALALMIGVLPDDIEGITFSPLWLILVLLGVWLIGTSIVIALINKRKVKP